MFQNNCLDGSQHSTRTGIRLRLWVRVRVRVKVRVIRVRFGVRVFQNKFLG